MHKRLKNWMESEGLKSSEFADTIGVNRATISHILSGRNKPSIDFFEKLLQAYPNLNANWLITGIGYMTAQKEVKEVRISKKIGKVVVFYDDQSFDEVSKDNR
jgi:transcriptional regulator with XRE-family HTH domain